MRHVGHASGSGSRRERRPLLREEAGGASGYGSRGHTDSSSNDEFVSATMTVPAPDARGGVAEKAVEATAASVAAAAEQPQQQLQSQSMSSSSGVGAAAVGTSSHDPNGNSSGSGVSSSMPADANRQSISSLIAQSTIHPLCLENTVARLDARGGLISVCTNTLTPVTSDRPARAEAHAQQQTLLTIRSLSRIDEPLVALTASAEHSAAAAAAVAATTTATPAPPVQSNEETGSLIDLS